MNVLIVDDNKEITDMLSFYLEALDGFNCTVVNDGNEGLKAIKSGDFDINILDLAMPGFSGIDIMNSLKMENLLEKMKIIILSASAINDEQLQSFLDDGVRAVLKKPISIDELTTVIEQIGH